MILAQNHPLRLNGNKGLFLLLIFVFSLGSCKQFRKTEKYEDTPPATVDGPRVDPTQVDTVKFQTKPNDYPPIADAPNRPVRPGEKPPTRPDEPATPTEPTDPVVPIETTPTENIQGSYNVAIMAPFNTHKETYGQVRSKTSIKSIEFYAGVKMALDRLGTEGVKLNVYTYDTQGSSSITRSIMSRPDFYNMNLIIGPMKTESVKAAAEWVKGKKNSVLVSPWNPKVSITKENPNYVQVNPSLETHCKSIMRHVRKNFSASKVVLACREETKESNNFKYFQDENKVISRNASAPQLRELVAEYGDDIPLHDYMQSDTTVFIIPSWDEKFVSNLLRKIYSAKHRSHVVVYGMPQWKDFERIGYEYYEYLNIHISHPNFMDKNNENVQNFRRDFYNLIGTVPSKDALLGYDTMLYFGRMLQKKGTTFNTFLDQENGYDYMHTQFHFDPIFKTGTDNFNKAERYENQYLNILEYTGFNFQKAD